MNTAQSTEHNFGLVVAPEQTTERRPLSVEEITRLFTEWVRLEVARGNPSPDTIRGYVNVIARFCSWCAVEGVAPAKVTREHLAKWRAELNSKYAAATVAYNVAIVRRFFAALQARGIRPDNPAASLKAPEPETLTEKPITYLAEQQLQRLIEALPKGDTLHELRDRALVLLMALHGLRTIEIVRLRTSDVHVSPDGMTLHVRGKRHARIVHVRPDVARVVERYLEARRDIPTPEMFVAVSTRCPGRKLTRRTVRRIVNGYLVATELKRPRVSCHALRHTAATLGYLYTRDLRAVQTMLGHRDPMTTARYAHLVDAREANPAAKIPVVIE